VCRWAIASPADRPHAFSRSMRLPSAGPLHRTMPRATLFSRRGTEPRRARPTRCEAAPPETEEGPWGLDAADGSSSGSGPRRLVSGTRSICGDWPAGCGPDGHLDLGQTVEHREGRAPRSGCRSQAGLAGAARPPEKRFLGECGIVATVVLRRPGAPARFHPDAEPSREERGQRGVRPRHQKRKKGFWPGRRGRFLTRPGTASIYVPGRFLPLHRAIRG
jgi:hypothetical protein